MQCCLVPVQCNFNTWSRIMNKRHHNSVVVQKQSNHLSNIVTMQKVFKVLEASSNSMSLQQP